MYATETPRSQTGSNSNPMEKDYAKTRNYRDGEGSHNGTDLYVGNIPCSLTSAGLTNLFAEHSQVVRAFIVKPRDENPHSTFGFVTVPSIGDAETCIRNVHNLEIAGHRLRVNLSQRKKANQTPDSGFGLDSRPAVETVSPAPFGLKFSESSSSPEQQQQEKQRTSASHNGGTDVRNGPTTPANLVKARSAVAGNVSTASDNRHSSSVSGDGASTERPQQECTRCGCFGKHRCSRCKAPYCSRMCQSTDWPEHKKVCEVIPALQPMSAASTSTCPGKTALAAENTASPVANTASPVVNTASPAANTASPVAVSPSARNSGTVAKARDFDFDLDNSDTEESKWSFSGFEDVLGQFDNIFGSVDKMHGRAFMGPEASNAATADGSSSSESSSTSSNQAVGDQSRLTCSEAIVPSAAAACANRPQSSSSSDRPASPSGSKRQKSSSSDRPASSSGSIRQKSSATSSSSSLDSQCSTGSGYRSSGDSAAHPAVHVLGLGAYSSNQFWARLSDDLAEKALHRLNSMLAAYGAGLSSPISTDQQTVNLQCVVKVSDGTFKRAKLVTLPVGRNRVSAHLVDDGHVVMVDCSSVFPIPDELHPRKLHALAFQLGLYGVRPVGYGQSEGGVTVLNDFIKDHQLSATILSRSPDHRIAYALVTDEAGRNVNDAIIGTPYADAFHAPSRPRSGLGRGARQVPSHFVPTAPGMQDNHHSNGLQNSSPQHQQQAAAALPVPTNVPIPGFSAARLQGSLAETPCLMPLPRGYQCIQLADGCSKVRLSCIHDEAAQFFVQVCMRDQADRLAHLNQSINTLHRKTRNSCFVPMLDEVCLARYTQDGLFYRVRILQEESPSTYLVSFVDYGNQTTIRLADLRHMRQDFGVLPFQAVRCALAGVGPADGSGMWSSAARELLRRPECLVARVVFKATKSNEPNLIELFDQTPPFNILLNKELVVNGVAMLRTAPFPLPNESSESTSSADFSRDANHAANGSNPENMHCIELEVGKDYPVRVVFIRHVSMFYITIMDDHAVQQFDEMGALIRQHCASPPDASFEPQIGDLCCAVFSEDGLYYRAKVQRKVTGDKLMILFVDFGSVTVVRKAEVRRMKDEFLTLPFQAIPAALQNIRKRSSGVWSDEAINFFAKLTDCKQLTCQCAARQELQNGATSALVLLYDDTDPASRVDISAELVKAGFALAVQGESADRSLTASTSGEL
eukprot:scpid16444/ scgid4447/ Tudor domain-containing protein 1; Cancer/testis antigen 41.1